MKLLTKENEKSLPDFYHHEEKNIPLKFTVKFFTPWSNWSWYAAEYDKETKTFYGYVQGFEGELGYFTLDEIKSVNGPFGLKIERDMNFSPKELSEIKN